MMMDEVELIPLNDDPMFLAAHPLYNSVVLTTLFKKLCPVEDLPNCRLVCKQWYGHSLDTWRQSRTLRLDFSKLAAATASYSAVCISNTLKQLLNFLKDPDTECTKRPYRKLHLNSWKFQLGPHGKFKGPWIERVCWGPILGAHITTLTLRNCKFGGVKEFQLIIYRFCPALQHLTLDWNTCEVQRSSEGPMTYREPEYGEQINLKSIRILNCSEEIPVSWLELFSHFPSLLHVGIRVEYCDSKVMEVLEALKVVKMQDGNKLPITDFDVAPYISISSDGNSLRTCAILREYNIPVKRVFFRLDQAMNRELVQSFIQINANSLIEIKVGKSDNADWAFPLDVPLKKLETFIIYSNTDPFTELEFLKYIPNIEKLSLWTKTTGIMNPRPPHPLTQMVANTLDTDLMATLQLLKLKEFKLEFTVGVEDLRRLVKWLPNIKTLGMVLDDDQFSIVCENWTKLECLVVYGDKLTDRGVIGGSEDNIGGEEAAEVDVRPNITYLENLTGFYASGCNHITQAAVLHIFLQMKKLNGWQIPVTR